MSAPPSPLVRALGTLLHGALLGIGVALGFGGLTLAGLPALETDVQRRIVAARDAREPATADLALTDVREQRLGESLRFLGVVANHGAVPVDTIYLDVDLFAGDTFITKCRQGLTVAAAPGQSRRFLLDCGPMVPHLGDYDRYEFALLGASPPR